jgi:signal recognition particle GTPase
MLDNLSSRLGQLVKTMRGHARLTEDNIKDALREVRMALLEADVALPVVKDFVAKVKEKAMGQEVLGSLTPRPSFHWRGERLFNRFDGQAKRCLEFGRRSACHHLDGRFARCG